MGSQPAKTVGGPWASYARVVATLEYVTNQGGLEVLDATSIANGNGVYRFTLPYATLESSGLIRLQDAYAVTCGEQTASPALDEDQVLEGRMVRGPDLRPRVVATWL